MTKASLQFSAKKRKGNDHLTSRREMTHKDSGNTDAPRVDEDEGRSGTRRVGNARREQEAVRNRRESELGTSWVSVILGWPPSAPASSSAASSAASWAPYSAPVTPRSPPRPALWSADNVAVGVPHRRLRRRAPREPLGPQARHPGPGLVALDHLAPGRHRRHRGGQIYRPALRIALLQVPGNVQNEVPQQGPGTILTVSGILALLVPLSAGRSAASGAPGPAATGRNRSQRRGRRGSNSRGPAA